MTAPTPGPVFKAPGLGLERGVNNFLQALTRAQQTELEKQRLASQQAVAEANIKRAEAETAATLAKTETERKAAEAKASAAKIFQTTMETTGGELNDAAIAGMYAQAKTPEAVQALTAMIPGIGDALATPAAVQGAQTETKKGIAELDQFERVERLASLERGVREQAARFLKDSLTKNPNMKLPADPNVREAVALEGLGLLGLIRDNLDREAAGATGRTASLIFARQAATQATAAAYRAYAEEVDFVGPEEAGSIPSPTSRKGIEKFLPPGMEYSRYAKLMRAATDDALVALGKPPQQGLPQDPALQDVLQGAAFQRLDESTQQGVLETARAIASGMEELREDTPSSIRAIIKALVKRMQSGG